MTFVWLHDRLVDISGPDGANNASVSVLDRGLTVGDGVFETMKVLDGVPFALTRHLDRLARSAAALDIDLPHQSLIREALRATALANAAEVGAIGRMRLTVTHGLGLLGDPYGGAGEPTMFVSIVAQHPWPQAAHVHLSAYRRNERSALTGVKSTSYAENAIALRQAKAAGADEALLLNTRDEVCEGTGSNIFVVLDGELITPPLESGCLNGVTRQLALHWTGAAERTIHVSDLGRITEAFLTSSTRDLHPIATLGDRQLPAPGVLTARAMQLWREGATVLDP